MAETAAHLAGYVFPRLAARQWVLSVPKRLRYLLQCRWRGTQHRAAHFPVRHPAQPLLGRCRCEPGKCGQLKVPLPPVRLVQPKLLSQTVFCDGRLAKPGITACKARVLMLIEGAILGLMRLNFLSVADHSARTDRQNCPTRLESINLRSVFRFPIERYAGQILPSQSAAITGTNR